MSENKFSKKDIINSLLKLGIKKGDSLFLGTSLGMFGLPNNVKTQNQLNKVYFDSLMKIVGKSGNILVPTYSYSFGVPHWKNFVNKNLKKKKFPRFFKKTRSEIGPFPNFFLSQKNVIRNIDPMVSIAGLGPKIPKLFKNLPFTSYGNNCTYERLLKLKNLKILSMGLGNSWSPFYHYIEKVCNVPYRFKKIYKGIIIEIDKTKEVKWEYHSRIMDKRTVTLGHNVTKYLNKNKIWKSTKLGRSKIFICNYKKFYDFIFKKVQKNKWLLATGPKFKV